MESSYVCVLVRMCLSAYGGNGQLASECLLESPPGEEWPVFEPVLSLKTKPSFKIHRGLGKNKTTVMDSDGTRKQDGAGEDQQQFARPTMCFSYLAMGVRNVVLTHSICFHILAYTGGSSTFQSMSPEGTLFNVERYERVERYESDEDKE
jgi:hypothetical protein